MWIGDPERCLAVTAAESVLSVIRFYMNLELFLVTSGPSFKV